MIGEENKKNELNTSNKKHPATVIAACYYLGSKLPKDAVLGKQPSAYLGKKKFKGTLKEILAIIGDKCPEINEEKLNKEYKNFKKRYATDMTLQHTKTDLTVYFTDWLLFAYNRGFSANDYFDYELYNKESDERDTFLNNGYRTRVRRACNDKAYNVFKDKAKFNKTFAEWVKREWVDTTECSFEEFKAFAEKHSRFFAKPVRGTGGAGARVIDTSEDTLENLYALCKKDELIVEQVIQQHDDLAAFNSTTLNTVRLNTLVGADNIPKVTLTVARFGRSGNVVDNFHGGGVGAIVDIESGIITSEAIDRNHCRKSVHPDSNLAIKGFKYPEWEKIKKAVCDAALLVVPHVRHIGWDVALNSNGEVELVEGNFWPNFDVLQSPDQIGRRHRYHETIKELEKAQGVTIEELEPLKIDITGMEIEGFDLFKKKLVKNLKKIKRKIFK